MLQRFILFIAVASLLVACCSTDMRARTIGPQMMIDLNDTTVALVDDDGEGGYWVSCSAVWLSSMRAATAAHCVSDAGMSEIDKMIAELTGEPWNPIGKPVQFVTWRDSLAMKDGGLTSAHAGIVVAYDRDNDLALIEAKEVDLDHGTASLAWEAPSQGAVVHALGMTLGLPWSYSVGVVGAVRTMSNVRGKQEKMIQVVSGANRGNSGGGLFDTDGRLVGICSFMATGSALIFYVHTDVVRDFLERN